MKQMRPTISYFNLRVKSTEFFQVAYKPTGSGESNQMIPVGLFGFTSLPG